MILSDTLFETIQVLVATLHLCGSTGNNVLPWSSWFLQQALKNLLWEPFRRAFFIGSKTNV